MGIELINSTLYNDPYLISNWRFEDNWVDMKSGYNLTPTNSPTFVTGMFNKGANFVKTSTQYASIAGVSCPNLNITGSQTFMCWYKPTVFVSGENHYLMNKGDAIHALWVAPEQGYARFILNGLTTNSEVINSSVVMSINNWYFLCGVYDSTNSKLKIWVNGTKVEVTASGSATSTAANWEIATRNTNSSYCATGILDDCTVFNRALTDAEVQAHYNGADGLSAGFLFLLT